MNEPGKSDRPVVPSKPANMSFWDLKKLVERVGRRSQKAVLGRSRYDAIAGHWLPLPRILHPYPEQRLAVFIQGKSPVR